mgnify:CR=1 FL=1
MGRELSFIISSLIKWGIFFGVLYLIFTNFGTFLIAIDRLIQQINFFNPNYRIDYIDVNDSDNFIWINRFEKSYYEDVLPEIWVQNINDSKEIQDEFRENATCEASKKYKEFNIG